MAEGYAIVATDYQGLGTAGVHPYGDGRTEAYNIADMVRAGRHVARDLSKKWVVIGQSQGGHAALFAMSVAPRYASELDFRGGVATGAPSNIEPLAPPAGPYFPKLPLNGLVSYFGYYMAGLRASRPDVNVDKFLTPVGRSVVDDAERMCYDEMHDRVDGVGIGDMLAKPLFEARFYQATRDALQVPLKGYTRPFFLAHGMLDLDVPVPLTMKLAADLKANKVPVTFKTYPGADHSGNMFASLPDTVPFVAKLFSGKASVG